jgi:methylated-DNA-[protein]-cysteine S-methyltransferase
MSAGFALIETALGQAGLVWHSAMVIGSQLPEATEANTRARLQRRYPESQEAALSDEIAPAAGAIRDLLGGTVPDLMGITLDMAQLPPFDRQVLAQCQAIPYGETRTYGDLARAMGDVRLSQRVGQALGRNPFAPLIPCHRVLGADGKAGGFSGGVGVATKLHLLNLEKARTGPSPLLFEALPLAVEKLSFKR